MLKEGRSQVVLLGGAGGHGAIARCVGDSPGECRARAQQVDRLPPALPFGARRGVRRLAAVGAAAEQGSDEIGEVVSRPFYGGGGGGGTSTIVFFSMVNQLPRPPAHL